MPTTVLFLAANPSDTERLALPREVNAINDRLRDTSLGGDEKLRGSFQLEQRWEVKASQLPAWIDSYKPTIVHFSGHGERSGEIVLTDDDGGTFPVDNDALANVFRNAEQKVRCVVLNACHSEPLARAIAEHVDCVIGMTRAVLDSDAIAFAGAFYAALGRGASVKAAFDRGCNQVELAHPSGGTRKPRELEPEEDSPATETKVPVLVTRPGVDPSKLVFVEPERRRLPWLPVLALLVVLLGFGGVVWYVSSGNADDKRGAAIQSASPEASTISTAAPSASASAEPVDAGSPDADASTMDAGDGGNSIRKPAAPCTIDLNHLGRRVTDECKRSTRPVSLDSNQTSELKSAYKSCGSFVAYRCPGN